MKNAIFITLISCMICSCISINPEYAHKEDTNLQYKLRELNISMQDIFYSDTNYNIYRIDKNVLQQLVSKSSKQYFLICNVRCFCSAEECLYTDTILNDFKADKNIQLIPVTEGNYTNKPEVEMYYRMKNYCFPTFMPDIYKYGCSKKEDTEQRMLAFLLDVFPETQLDELSGGYILFDRNFNLLKEGKYNANSKNIITKLAK